MRHRVNTRKLGRTSAHRVAMYRNLVSSLLEHEKVETTHAKAREVKRLADRMITLGKRGDLHARRQAMRVVHGRDVTGKLFGELAERYANRPGGYTRVLRTRRRVGDNAEMSIVQLVEKLEAPAAEKAPAKRKAASKKTGAKKTAAKKTGTKKTGKKKTAKAAD
jgi:large subunit ribosomal protein L17